MPNAEPTPRRDELYTALLDAMPNPVFIVDDDVRIQDANQAARPLLGVAPDMVLRRRSGEALHCIHAETAGGCGRAAACTLCVVRNSVKEAFAGQRVVRRMHRMLRQHGGQTDEVFLLVTAAPWAFEGRRLALLIFEDINELVNLRKILPMCANCKKIRNDQSYWENLESYFKKQLDVDFSHGICPDCIRKLYPDLAEDPPGAPPAP
ncbi:MAG: PAS domain-containing protein [Kiritimatiellaeota bacterium]|nr:PAS domain-containing protein [Kiritimatiellota bacterium]